jgi:polyketide cyclase/dehydrase/lipid transport protein
MVSDLTRMGEWSPENEGATWLRGASGPQPGATFRGMNRNGKKKWKTEGTIVDADPGRLLTFRITAAGFKVAEWRYELETTATGCRVTETWIDQRGRIAKALGKPVSGVEDRAAHNRATMEHTLERLKSTVESASASS